MLVEVVSLIRGIAEPRVAPGPVSGSDTKAQAVGVGAGDHAQGNAGGPTYEHRRPQGQVHVRSRSGETPDQQNPVSRANGRVGFAVDERWNWCLSASDAAGVSHPAIWLVGGQGV